jgi:hypothetical protein
MKWINETILLHFKKTADFCQQANRYNLLSLIKFKKKEEKLLPQQPFLAVTNFVVSSLKLLLFETLSNFSYI